ncbi:MAG: NUDIX hydrolase [Magnetococcales bacterium]|nr:NUDIX hydrolase [Magnetococcales bacterium]
MTTTRIDPIAPKPPSTGAQIAPSSLDAEADAPYVRVGRRLVFENQRFHIYADHLRDPAGEEIPDYLTVIPKIPDPDEVVGVSILPEIGGRFQLLRIYRPAFERWMWEAPGGFRDSGETTAESALRELTEETGLVCQPENLHFLGAASHAPGVIRSKVHMFAALDCQRQRSVSSDEIGMDQNTFLFTPDQVHDLMAEEKLMDAASVIGFHRAMLLQAFGRPNR